MINAISRLKTLNIYEEPWENQTTQVVNNTQQVVTERQVTNMYIVSTSMLCNE